MEALGELDGLVLETIILKIGAKSAAALAGTSTRLRTAASADAVWRGFCADDFDLTDPVDPDGNPLPSFKAAYAAWCESFKNYPIRLVKRAKTLWTSMQKYLSTNFPEALETLNKGLSENTLESYEKTLGFKLPTPTRVLYRFFDGQNTKISTESSQKFTFGLIGGYEFYNHFVNVHLLPLNEALLLTKRLSRDLDCLVNSEMVIIATSCNWRKLFFHDCKTGQLFVGTQNLVTDGELLPCVKPSLVGDGLGFLVWLEEHFRRLENGVIGIRVLKGFKSISLYPEGGPLCSEAITNGVKVRASAVLVPEGSRPGEEGSEGENPDRYLYSYSIRLSLLPEGCMLDKRYYSCQLASRHWLIKTRGVLTSDVNGEGVIGEYPVLTPGMEEFVYESAASLHQTPGSIEGSFTFVPGRLSRPEGRQFEARVAPFELEDLQFIY